jgi:L-aminopeptidase/D-esterase-like protein
MLARTSPVGPALEFELPGLEIGVAEYDEGPTGTTVFHFPTPVMAVIDVRGGAPGTVNTDTLRLAYDAPVLSALTFAGGSAFGLAVAAGVADELKTRRPDPGHWRNIPIVVGGIIFDLGSRRFSTVTPDAELGRAALRSARAGWFPLGARGAGRFAMQGPYLGDAQYSGQGGACGQVGPTKVAVFTVVNSSGAIVDRHGETVRPGDVSGGPIADRLAAKLKQLVAARPDDTAGAGLSTNTTLTLLATNQKLPLWALQRVAVHVHTSMARALQPFATETDGDMLCAVTTGEVDNPGLSPRDLAVLGSEIAWDAVLASVPALPAVAGSSAPPTSALDQLAGTYEFVPGKSAVVRRRDRSLVIELGLHESLYLPAGQSVDLRPVAGTEFVLSTPRADRIAFDVDTDGRASGLVINPGPWAIPARRVA